MYRMQGGRRREDGREVGRRKDISTGRASEGGGKQEKE